jgi:prevent-host-death family protein
MRTTTITEAKNGLSALIDRVRAGESIVILDRGTPVARLEPVANDPDASGRIKRLERAGIVRAGSAAPPLDLMRTPGPELTVGGSAVNAVLDERRSDR